MQQNLKPLNCSKGIVEDLVSIVIIYNSYDRQNIHISSPSYWSREDAACFRTYLSSLDTNIEQNSVKPHHYLNARKPSQDAKSGKLQKQLRAFNTSNASKHCKMCSRKLSRVIFRWQFLQNFLQLKFYTNNLGLCWNVDVYRRPWNHWCMSVWEQCNDSPCPGTSLPRTPNPALWKN